MPLSFGDVDELKKMYAADPVGVTAQADASAVAWLPRMAEYLAKHPLFRNYVRHLGGANARNREPWCALGERLYAAGLVVAAARGVNPGVEFMQEGWNPGYAMGVVVGISALSVPYLWLEDVERMVRSTPLPRNTISRSCLPYPVLFISYEVAHGNGEYEGNWMLLQDVGDGFNIVADCCDLAEQRLGIMGWSVEYGKTWPDDFPEEGGQRQGVGAVLKRLAFINSPYTRSEGHRLPRPLRREITRAGVGKAGAPEPLVYTVTLRRASADPHPRENEGAEGSIEWKHHWWVSGHFRAQWYPSEQAHRVVWVAPYVKGDLSKPLLEKVYVVAR